MAGEQLPPGYSLSGSDPDVLALRRANSTLVARFSIMGATEESIAEVAFKDYRSCVIEALNTEDREPA